MPTSDWRDKAAFLRDVGAVYGEWNDEEQLVKLQLGPAPTPAAPRPLGPARQMQERFQASIRQDPKPDLERERARQRHETMFAASRIRPRLDEPETPESAVPRAVRAKEAALNGGQAKRKKR